MQNAHLKKRRLPKQKVRDESPFLVSTLMAVGLVDCSSDEREAWRLVKNMVTIRNGQPSG